MRIVRMPAGAPGRCIYRYLHCCVFRFRHQSKTAVKKVVPAKIVASLPEAANSRQVEPVASSLAPDTVASAAVAAVVATQTFMKVLLCFHNNNK